MQGMLATHTAGTCINELRTMLLLLASTAQTNTVFFRRKPLADAIRELRPLLKIQSDSIRAKLFS